MANPSPICLVAGTTWLPPAAEWLASGQRLAPAIVESLVGFRSNSKVSVRANGLAVLWKRTRQWPLLRGKLGCLVTPEF